MKTLDYNSMPPSELRALKQELQEKLEFEPIQSIRKVHEEQLEKVQEALNEYIDYEGQTKCKRQ